VSLSITEKIGLKLRGLPVGRIQKALALAQAAGISLNHEEIAVHLMCGRPVEPIIEALILAKREGVPTSWQELSAVDLASQGKKFDVLSAVRASAEIREMTFSSFSPDLKEPLAGICRDGSRVKAECHLLYRLPVSHVFALRLEFLQERLATRIAALIFDAANPARLQMSRTEHEGSLLVLAQSVMPTVQKVELKYDAMT
jgi:SigmaW regulon antibacterial